MCNIECPYKEKCTSYRIRCCSCKHNKGKKDYYEPKPYPWVWPYIWPYIWPWWDPYPYWHWPNETTGTDTWTTTVISVSSDSNYYEAE